MASGHLAVAVYDDFRPFSYVEDGVAKGIDVDVGQALAERLGVKANIIVRMAGEKMDDDLRVNVWRGPVTGGGVADIMLHVPIDRELAHRNDLVFWGVPYYQETIAIAVDPARVAERFELDLFRTETVAVEVDTVPDFFLSSALGGQVRGNIRHYLRFEEARDAFERGETAALMGTRAQIESHLRIPKLRETISDFPLPPLYRSTWAIGFVVKTDSRDLAYALNDHVRELRASGELEAIFARHGVTFAPPPAP
jgi:ABC-type amino acid transport substrate-binding protein